MKSLLKQHMLKARHWFAVLALLLAFAPAVAHASVYGSGTYNSDVYNGSESSSGGGSSGSSSGGGTDTSSASATDESTVVETPSGLEVAINLANGQVIPRTGYYITITPLNGEGKTFDKAEIYLDGKLMYTGTPDSTGTLKWFWDTAQYPASKVKIIVYGPGSGTTTKEFSVTIGSSEQTSHQNTGAESVPNTSSGFPAWLWWVFGLLLLLIVLLIWWLIARSRHRDDQQLPPPPMYTPMQ